MFNEFEAFMSRWLMPIAQRVDKQRHLSVIKVSMVAMTPLTILGNFFAIIPTLPNMIGENNAFGQFTLNNAELLDLLVTLSIGMTGVYVTMCIVYNLGSHYKLYIPGCITLSIFVFPFAAAENVEGGINITNFGVKGLFRAALIGMAAMELYRFCKEKNLTVRMPEGVPDFASESFELILTIAIAAGTSITVCFFSQQTFGALSPQIPIQFLAPLVGSMDNLWVVLFLHFMICLIFFSGIHPSVFGPITRPIMVTLIMENVIARQAGGLLSHSYMAGTSSALFGFTGAGITIGYVVTCMPSESKRYRKIGQVVLFPSLFGINEPILSGAPITLNPIMFIPFVFGGAIVGTTPMFLMHYGLLDKPFFDSPYVGVFLEGFLTNGDWRVILACGAQLILVILFYLPFFKVMERQELREEEARAKKVEEAKNISSDDEEALLNDLDLDFQQQPAASACGCRSSYSCAKREMQVQRHIMKRRKRYAENPRNSLHSGGKTN